MQPGDTKEAATSECDIPSPACGVNESGEAKNEGTGAVAGRANPVKKKPDTSCFELCDVQPPNEICECLFLQNQPNQEREIYG